VLLTLAFGVRLGRQAIHITERPSESAYRYEGHNGANVKARTSL